MTPLRKHCRPVTAALMLLLMPCAGASAQEAGEQRFEGSLFFTPHEQQAINTALAMRPAQNTIAATDNPLEMLQIPESQPSWSINRLHLSALIFYEPQRWSLWFGNRQVRKHTIPPYLSDLKVYANHIDVSVLPRPGAAPIPVRLRPNQTFLIEELRIIEGGLAAN